METGIVGLHAPPLENVRWIDENGDERSPLGLAELGQGFRILYFFQDWCAGCHAHGFPTFVTLAEELRDKAGRDTVRPMGACPDWLVLK